MVNVLKTLWTSENTQKALESLQIGGEEDKLVLLESSLGSIDPSSIPSRLYPDTTLHCGWYIEWAMELATTGKLDSAISLLNVLSSQDDGKVQRLKAALTRFKMITDILAETEPNSLKNFTFKEYLDTGIAAIFDNKALRSRDALFRLFLAKGLFRSVREFHQHAPRCGKNRLSSILAERLPRPLQSLRAELTEMREDRAGLRRRVGRVMELMVRRRELGEMDLDCWRELRRYQEFSTEVQYEQLESMCFEQLEVN